MDNSKAIVLSLIIFIVITGGVFTFLDKHDAESKPKPKGDEIIYISPIGEKIIYNEAHNVLFIEDSTGHISLH